MAAVSGVALLAFAARMLVRVVVLDSESDIKTSLASSFFGAIGFGLFNPITPLLFAAAAPVLLDRGDALPVLVVGGLFLGSLSWWLALSTGVFFLCERLTNRTLHWTNKAAGLAFAGLA